MSPEGEGEDDEVKLDQPRLVKICKFVSRLLAKFILLV